jgi:Domain of unknown function (DUF6089)
MKRSLLVLLTILPILTFAQVGRHHEMGIFGGTANYFGDLKPDFFGDYSYTPVGGLQYKYSISPRASFRFGANFAEITSADSLSRIASQRQRNLDFTTNLFELHSGVEINLLKVDLDYYKFSPYIFGGLGVYYSNPFTGDLNDNKVYLKPLSTEGQGLPPYTDRKQYNLVNFSMPMGGGLKLLVGKKVMVTTELGVRLAFSDYLDDVSKSFANMDTLQFYKGKQAVDLSWRTDELYGKTLNEIRNYPNQGYRRGDNRSNDWYWFGGIGLAIYFDSFGNLWPNRQTQCSTKRQNF